jgi:hypothetical protein
MSKLDFSAFPDSQSNASQYSFYIDGQNVLTNSEVWRFKYPYATRITGVGVSIDSSRTAGTLTLTLKKNGSSIGSIILNGTDPQDKSINLDEPIVIGDVVTAEITTASFTPLRNVGHFFIQTK